METFRSCPVCTEEFQKVIYQCEDGHIICKFCIYRVTGGLCPQCRYPFGKKKIRNRALEEILGLEGLDGHGCKFKYRGCKYSCKRVELADHIKFCPFNPEFPLCELFTGKDDMFRFISVSKNDIISHFNKEHHCYEQEISGDTWFFVQSGGLLTHLIDKKPEPSSTTAHFVRLFKFSALELNALFLIYGKVSHVEDTLSVGCIKVHDSSVFEYTQYSVEFQLSRNRNPIFPSPICDPVKVSSVADVRQSLKTSKVNFSIEMLRNIGFGEERGDTLLAKIVYSNEYF